MSNRHFNRTVNWIDDEGNLRFATCVGPVKVISSFYNILSFHQLDQAEWTYIFNPQKVWIT